MAWKPVLATAIAVIVGVVIGYFMFAPRAPMPSGANPPVPSGANSPMPSGGNVPK